ncbi:hypothetical protein [Thiothrix fructosivorans]|uniref:Uncharacterized protein n=1 Tax=Thiothrix fructosivorans TaxID=111770 RepID=A0A8B0SFC7_9GAMM|nr:hypothetical protein [Thiothrix fructosivorans]MBO0615283.1 hypothetical protein [Thiothrix fructosivorans]QTX10066.1 hypothetical protein J1836_015900 [Thiothrix fructosivorans]
MKFNLPNNNGKLPTDQHRAMKNYRLMQWAKVATFGLYMVAVFMLYVSDVWGVASFVTQNSNEFIALSVFSIISFVLAFFLASSKEAVYEDIALHRSEGWKLKPTQYAAMGLFLSSGILFEMFSTTNNQQHIANTAAEQSTMMKSIQGTDVSLLGSANLTDSFASAQMKLAQCEQRLAQGKEKHCAGAKARVDAVRESMTMSNQLATTAAQQSVDNKVDGMLKIREHFDKPMFQAIGKATGTDNNSGMLMVIGVLIFIFECQHIMALFAYANSLARINRKDSKGLGLPADDEMKERREAEAMAARDLKSSSYDFKRWADEKEAKAPLAAFANSAKQTVGEYAAKVEAGLKASPYVIAREYARADYANKQVLADAGRIGGKIGAKLDDALNAENRKNYPQKIQFPVGEGKTAEDYDLIPRTDKTPTLSGENTLAYLTPRLSVEETVKHIQANVKQSGATSPDAIQAAVFDTFAAMPNPAPLSDVILERIAGKLVEQAVTTVHAQPEQTRTEAQPEQHEQPVTTVHAQPEQTMPELTAAAKQAESDLYPEWVKQVSAKAITSGARDSKRFISQATFTHGDKTVLSVQEMGRIWLNWQDRAARDGVLTANPKYQPNNRQPKYLLAA